MVGYLNAQKSNTSTAQPLLDNLDALPVEAMGVPRCVGNVVTECDESRVELRQFVDVARNGAIDRVERVGIEISREGGKHCANIRDTQIGVEADHPERARFTVAGEQENMKVVASFDDHPPNVVTRTRPGGKWLRDSGISAPPRTCGRLDVDVALDDDHRRGREGAVCACCSSHAGDHAPPR